MFRAVSNVVEYFQSGRIEIDTANEELCAIWIEEEVALALRLVNCRHEGLSMDLIL